MPGPSARKRFLVAGVLVSALLHCDRIAALAQTPAEKLREVERERQERREQEKTLAEQAEKLKSEAQKLRGDLVRIAARLQAEEEVIGEIEDRLYELGRAERARGANLEARHGELSATLSVLAQLARTPPEAMIASPGAAADNIRAAILLRDLVPELEARAARLRGEIAELAELRQRMEAERKAVADGRARLTEQRRDLERLVAERGRTQAELVARGREARDEATRLDREARDLKALMERLAEEERRRAIEAQRLKAEQEARARAEAEARARRDRDRDQAAQARTAPPPAAPDEDRERPRLAVVTPPPEDRGGLSALPVRGRTVGLFGQAAENGLVARGISIETRDGAQVTAPAGGKIVFAGPFRGYGQLLIIAHTDEYHSLLAGFARIDGAVGQNVVAGEPVGVMGGSEGQRPVLYLELRRKGEPVNPLPWLATNGRKVSG